MARGGQNARRGAWAWLAFVAATAVLVSPVRVIWASERAGAFAAFALWALLLLLLAALNRTPER